MTGRRKGGGEPLARGKPLGGAGSGRAAVMASDAKVEAAVRELTGRANAADLVCAGVFAAAALVPSVLLGPVQLLVGGAGTGLLAVDGRVQQPGRGLARPRGFVEGEPIPEAARVGAPVLCASISTVLASFGASTLTRVLGPAIEIARPLAPLRADVLRRVAERGPAALAAPRVAGELVLAAGRGKGGLLSPRDLDELRPAVVKASMLGVGEHRLATVPWGAAAVRDPASPGAPAGDTRIVAAADGRGQLAVACYEVASRGMPIDTLELVAPYFAQPVLRGKTRVPPGLACEAAAPIALVESEGAALLAAGAGARTEGERLLGGWLRAWAESPGEVPAGIVGVLHTVRGGRTIGAHLGPT